MNDLPSIVTPDGETRLLNLQPSNRVRLAEVPARGLTLPDSEILNYDTWPVGIRIKNQGQVGACNGFATAVALEYARYQSAQPYVPLSAWYVYGRLVHGRDTGSSILDALDLIISEGCAPESLIREKDFSGSYGPQAMASAKRFQAEECIKLQNWEEVLARVALRQPVNLSIRVGARFNDLDSEGAPGVGYGPGNHAVMVGGGIKTSKKWGRMVRMRNSWGPNWGWNGECWLGRAHIEAGTWFEAFTIRAVNEDLVDMDNPPAAA